MPPSSNIPVMKWITSQVTWNLELMLQLQDQLGKKCLCLKIPMPLSLWYRPFFLRWPIPPFKILMHFGIETLQLATGTGIAPFRSFLWKMFFEKHDDYKVKQKQPFPALCECEDFVNWLIIIVRLTWLKIAMICSSMVWHGSSWVSQQVAHCSTRRWGKQIISLL